MKLMLMFAPFLSLALLFPALSNAENGCSISGWYSDAYFEFEDSTGNSFTPYFFSYSECKANYEKAKSEKGPLRICGCQKATNKTMAIIAGTAATKSLLYCYDIDAKGVATKKLIDSWAYEANNAATCDQAKRQALSGALVRVK